MFSLYIRNLGNMEQDGDVLLNAKIPTAATTLSNPSWFILAICATKQ